MKYITRLTLGLAIFIVAHTASAATITVTTTSTVSSDGNCSLTEAIANANNNNDSSGGDCASGQSLPTVDTIEFAIPGAGPHTISISSEINIQESVIIDGTTQSGTVCTLEGGNRALKINIDGSGISSNSNIFNIPNGADDVTIKGLAIYGNEYSSGIATSANHTTVQCSNIGTDSEGLVAYPNRDGIAIYNNGTASSGHVFGGPNPGDGNIVSGNNVSESGNPFDGHGISCGASNILIQGNWIGLDSTGQDILPNKNAGIYCGNAGPVPYDNIQILDNVISGNGTQGEINYAPGINLGGAENANTNGVMSNITIKGNIIGLSADGLVDLGNQNSGVFIGASTSNVIIGGLLDGEENIISGNGTDGLFIGYDTDTVSILGNIIGLASDGVTRIANGSYGISLVGPRDGGGGTVTNINIGGSASGSGNIISGNGSDGVYISTGLDIVFVQGNIIGPDSTGTTCVENSVNSGIAIANDVLNVTIGGNTTAHRNIIGCATQGINSYGTDTLIQGNYIGVGADGNTPITDQNSNQQLTGIQINTGASVIDNVIKFNTSEGIKVAAPAGVSLIQGNDIQDNANAGIVIFGTISNPDPVINILQNNITNNDQTGIKLGMDLDNDYYPDDLLGHTVNDLNDTDTGPNNLLNHPVVLMTLQDGSDMSVMYGLDVPVGYYRVEFFTNPTNGVSNSGFGEGEVYEGYEFITKSILGFESYTKTLTNASISEDVTLTVTACDDALCTNYLGTSEFSNTAPLGVDYDGTDYTASHVLNTVYLGTCVNGDNGNAENDDMGGPNQVGAKLGTGDCMNDVDGVAFVTGDTVLGSPSYQTDYQELADTPSVNDATFSGTYTGERSNNQMYIVIVSVAPDNGDDADYFIWIDDEEIISSPIKITPGIPQLIDHGIYITFANATGHTAFDFQNLSAGQLWGVLANAAGLVPSSEPHGDTYTPGETVNLSVTASDAGYIHVWIDTNRDNDFGDTDEHIIVNEEVIGSSNAFSFVAPTQLGTYALRVRYTAFSDPDLGPTGLANDGEVEDYTITVAPAPSSRKSRTIGFNPNFTKPITQQPVSADQILGSGQCPANLIINDFMKQGDRNGVYSTYNKKLVKEVNILQAHINRILAAQYNQAAGPVDGIFGPLTKQGVMRLQTALNTILKPIPILKIDGIVGPFTRSAINNSCGSGGLVKS